MRRPRERSLTTDITRETSRLAMDRTRPNAKPLDIDLRTMSRTELLSLAEEVEREIDTRAFEENLKRELNSHQRRSQWQGNSVAPGGRRRA